MVSRWLVATTTLLLGISGLSAVIANVRACQAQEQRYEQIKPTARTLEVNSALFSAADKGCVELARAC